MKPKHYDNGKEYDTIDFCNDYKLNFNRGSVIKHVARAGKKDNEIQDLKKAVEFLKREIKHLKIKEPVKDKCKHYWVFGNIANKECKRLICVNCKKIKS